MKILRTLYEYVRRDGEPFQTELLNKLLEQRGIW